MIGLDRATRRRRFRRGVLVGLVAAGTMATCMAPPKARAEPFAQVTGSDGATITLRTDKGPCVGEALLAVWQAADLARTVQGCWIIVTIDGVSIVLVSFLDGERGNIPARRLVKVRAL